MDMMLDLLTAPPEILWEMKDGQKLLTFIPPKNDLSLSLSWNNTDTPTGIR